MYDQKIFNTPAEALCYMVECTMATLEGLKLTKRSSKSELRRHENLVDLGIRNCQLFGVREIAAKIRCHRVLNALLEREIQRM